MSRGAKLTVPDPWWFAIVRVGDVVRFGRSYRVVREVTHGTHRLRALTFAIRHPSWTRRCYTVVNASELKQRNAEYAGVRVKLDSDLDHAIAGEIGKNAPFLLTACDVRGVP